MEVGSVYLLLFLWWLGISCHPYLCVGLQLVRQAGGQDQAHPLVLDRLVQASHGNYGTMSTILPIDQTIRDPAMVKDTNNTDWKNTQVAENNIL